MTKKSKYIKYVTLILVIGSLHITGIIVGQAQTPSMGIPPNEFGTPPGSTIPPSGFPLPDSSRSPAVPNTGANAIGAPGTPPPFFSSNGGSHSAVSDTGTSTSSPSSPTYSPSASPSASPSPSLGAPASPHNVSPTANPASPVSPKPDTSLELRSVAEASHPLAEVMKLQRLEDSKIQGKELYLHQVLTGVTSSETKRLLLHEYWDLTEKYLVHKFRLAQMYLLLDVISPQYTSDQEISSQIDLAIALVDKQQKAAELEFIQAQYIFAEILRRNNGTHCPCDAAPAGLAIPADFPLVVTYNTESGRLALSSTKAQLLDKVIPLQCETVRAYEEAGKAAEQYLLSLMKNRRTPVDALENCINERIQMLHAIITYNKQIADYVAETVAPEVTGRRFLSVVVQLPKQTTSPQTSILMPVDQHQQANEIQMVSAASAQCVVVEPTTAIAQASHSQETSYPENFEATAFEPTQQMEEIPPPLFPDVQPH